MKKTALNFSNNAKKELWRIKTILLLHGAIKIMKKWDVISSYQTFHNIRTVAVLESKTK